MKLAVNQILKRSTALVLLACLAGAMAFAQSSPQHNNPGPPPQNVVVVNGAGQPVPTAAQGTTNVAGTVNVGNTPSVNVMNTPAVTISGTPSVNANVQFPANQAVTVTPGSATNVGRFPSQQVQLAYQTGCPSTLLALNPDGTNQCFDMANYPGQILIITDFSWSALGGVAGVNCAFNFDINNHLLYIQSALTNYEFVAQNETHLTTGLKMTVAPNFLIGGSCTSINDVHLQGYLLPNQ
jgi:hypothetical protein